MAQPYSWMDNNKTADRVQEDDPFAPAKVTGGQGSGIQPLSATQQTTQAATTNPYESAYSGQTRYQAQAGQEQSRFKTPAFGTQNQSAQMGLTPPQAMSTQVEPFVPSYSNTPSPYTPTQYTPAPAPGYTNGGYDLDGTWNPGVPTGQQMQVPQSVPQPSVNQGTPVDYYSQLAQQMGLENLTPESFADKNNPLSRFLENLFPLIQAQQNAGQWGAEFNEGNRRYWHENQFNQNQAIFGMEMALRQQGMSEWEAQQAAQQWAAQFNHQTQMDLLNYTLMQDQQALDKFIAQGGWESEQAVAGLYADAQKYQADQQLAGAGLYSGAQRYEADQNLAGVRYRADVDAKINAAQMLMQRYGIDAETAWRMADRESNERIAALQTYGRAQPGMATARWNTGWG